MTLDFIDRLKDECNKLELAYPLKIGQLDTTDSIALYSLPGGKVIESFYDGTVDKGLNYEFSIKTKDQKQTISILDMLSSYLQEKQDIPSQNNSYIFNEITVVSESYFVGKDEAGFFFYSLTIQANLMIPREE
ncbi:minor capsid protein [Listeria aquatica]|uniref:Minor capsid protein n=1 Tax=Listeria aquatica TaxID=1494960 RepID=A0A841ZSP1_9LIST|nr:minor capsid protein [Listeria aquatica]MBC1522412.1 minor capsid protein [Listeria aquatica]